MPGFGALAFQLVGSTLKLANLVAVEREQKAEHQAEHPHCNVGRPDVLLSVLLLTGESDQHNQHDHTSHQQRIHHREDFVLFSFVGLLERGMVDVRPGQHHYSEQPVHT